MAKYNQTYNPIKGVNGVAIPVPSAYTYTLEDVSESDAGRTQDGTMHKLKLGEVCSLSLKWEGLTTAEVSTILNAFSSEYFNVNYLDAKAGEYLTREFYVGNRTAPMYNGRLGLWENVSFNIIQRSVV